MPHHFLTLPLEIRTNIFKYLLPRRKIDITKDGCGVLQSYIALTAVNKQIRAEILDTFNTTIPIDLKLEGSWIRGSWTLWGYTIHFQHPDQVEEAVIFNPEPINLRHARKFMISLDAPIHWSGRYEDEAVSKEIEAVLGTLKFVEKIAKLDVELMLRPALYDRVKRPHDRAQYVEIVACAARRYGDLFKSKLASVSEASLTVMARSDCVDEADLELFHAKLKDYRREWQREIVQLSG
jgi:hypothetical protein